MLLFFAIAAGLVALYLLVQTVRPLMESGVVTAAEWQRVEDESLQLLERRDQLLAELQELEFEAALHKIDARDLEALRARYAREAVELDKRIDAQREAYGDRIEAQVEKTLSDAARRRADKAGDAAPDVARSAPAAPAAAEAAPTKGEAAVTPAASAQPEGASTDDDPGAARVLAPGEAWDGPSPCGQCGNAMAPDSAFCDGCGSPVLRACASCGAANRLQARFCKACGDRVEGEGA